MSETCPTVRQIVKSLSLVSEISRSKITSVKPHIFIRSNCVLWKSKFTFLIEFLRLQLLSSSYLSFVIHFQIYVNSISHIPLNWTIFKISWTPLILLILVCLYHKINQIGLRKINSSLHIFVLLYASPSLPWWRNSSCFFFSSSCFFLCSSTASCRLFNASAALSSLVKNLGCREKQK